MFLSLKFRVGKEKGSDRSEKDPIGGFSKNKSFYDQERGGGLLRS